MNATATTVHIPRIRGKRTPERVILHNAFNAWLQQPQIEERYTALVAVMKDHELKERLRKLLPAAPLAGLDGIPLQDITPLRQASSTTNPDHRSTRLEFLADANHYGA